MKRPTPIFLLSLPRSGSTLVQRVLAGHDEIATAPETWIMLPQVYALREQGAYAEYGQIPASRAIREFAQRLAGDGTTYDAELRRFALSLYARAGHGTESFFVDKTPRYHLIADDLFRIFPDAKFVFLWRHPIAIVSSISETWGGGNWNLAQWRTDVYDGVANLVDAYLEHADRSFAVQYENLVADPASAWTPLFDYLGVPFDPQTLETFTSIRMEARMGDSTGSRDYRTLTTQPLTKWRATVGNPFRKRWCRRYLEWIGPTRLAVMGYDLEALLRELDEAPNSLRRIGADLTKNGYGWFKRAGRRQAATMLWRQRPR